MKGIFKISETFMKILSTGYIAVVFVSIFFSLQYYHLIMMENKLDRDVMIVGNAFLSSCMAETSGGLVVKGLLSEERINEEIALNINRDKNIHCMNYDKRVYVEIYKYDEYGSLTLLYGLGDFGVCKKTNPNQCDEEPSTILKDFPAALKRSSGTIPVLVEVFVGV